MLKIRLSRVGKSHTPIYRLVVAEKSRAVKRENIEILGLYNPTNKEDKFQVKKDRVLYWIGLGAQTSETVQNLLCDFDVLPKKDKVKIVYGKKMKKKDKKESADEKSEKVVETSETEDQSSSEIPAENHAKEEETAEKSETENNTLDEENIENKQPEEKLENDEKSETADNENNQNKE